MGVEGSGSGGGCGLGSALKFIITYLVAMVFFKGLRFDQSGRKVKNPKK